MKIIKTASGNKISISKKEWESIGKTAGWKKVAQYGDGMSFEEERARQTGELSDFPDESDTPTEVKNDPLTHGEIRALWAGIDRFPDDYKKQRMLEELVEQANVRLDFLKTKDNAALTDAFSGGLKF